MASLRNSTQITWPTSANSITLNTNSAQISEAFAWHAEDWDADIEVSASNQGTPASGDVVDFWISYTTGDVLGDSGDDYDTPEHSAYLGRLDTYATNTPGENPARRTFTGIATANKGFKLIATAAQGASRSVVVRAMVSTHRPQ